MCSQTDPDFLSEEEYGNASSLTLRTRIQERFRSNPQSWFEWVYDHLPYSQAAQILELGCGAGDLWLQNQGRLPSKGRAVLTDLSPGMLADAHHSLQAALSSGPALFSMAVADAQHIPAPACAFDLVIGLGILDHLPNCQEALYEVSRVLKPGGIFCTSAGGFTHLQEIEALVRPFLPDANYGGDPQRFGLETGTRILSPWFAHVQRERYENTLVFRQPGPVLRYIFSEAAVQTALAGEQREALRLFVEAELSVRGELRVTSDKGIFLAQKAL